MKTENYVGNSCKTGVYAICNDINGKMYIGATKRSFHSRKTKHLTGLTIGKHFNYRLSDEVKQFGIDNFTFRVMMICDKSKCDFYEARYIKVFKTNEPEFGYNISPTLYFKFKRKLRQEVLTARSEYQKKRACELNGLENPQRGLNKAIVEYDINGGFIRKYNSEREYCKPTKSGISNVSTTLANRKLYHKGKIIAFENDLLTEEDIKKVKETHSINQVSLYSLSGDFISDFKSVKSCAEFIGCKDAEVRMCYTGRRSRIKKYIVKLKN